MEISTEIEGSDSPISDQNLESLSRSFHKLRSKSAISESDLLLCRNQRHEAIGRKNDGSDSHVSDHGLGSLHQSFHEFEFESKASTSESDVLLRHTERCETIDPENDSIRTNGELSPQRDSLRRRNQELEAEISETARVREEMKKDPEVFRERIHKLEAELKENSEFVLTIAESVQCVKDRLLKAVGRLNDEEEDLEVFPETDGDEGRAELEFEQEPKELWQEKISAAMKLTEEVASTINRYIKSSERKRMHLERNVVSLTEENSDISALLRVALLEKDEAEKKLKGLNEQKRVALLQIAERGLQRVGFGFGFGFGSMVGGGFGSMVGGGSQELTAPESSGTGNCQGDNGGECCEGEPSLALTVEKIMKNLRHEISHLRRSLEESRLDNERLQRLTEKRAQKLAENAEYISELEDRERVLAQNVDELVMELTETEAETRRWREACELEVEAGKHEVEERDRLIAIMKVELQKAKSASAISEGKVKLKEELVKAAMAAEAAAEKSLLLADRRAAELLSRIEQLTHQLDEAESAERSRRKLRHTLCWPWLTVTAAATATATSKYVRSRGEVTGGMLLPDTRASLRYGA